MWSVDNCGEQGVLYRTHSTGEHGVLCGALTIVENKEYCVEHKQTNRQSTVTLVRMRAER